MTRFMCALGSALLVSGAPLLAQGQAPALQDVKTIGCIRLWRPAPADPTQMPVDRQPGLAGVYLLTPTSSSPATETDLPTYVITPSATFSFSQHAGHKVEITGTAQTAPPPTTEIATAPTQRPENNPTTNGMPRLTVSTMKMLTESCP